MLWWSETVVQSEQRKPTRKLKTVPVCSTIPTNLLLFASGESRLISVFLASVARGPHEICIPGPSRLDTRIRYYSLQYSVYTVVLPYTPYAPLQPVFQQRSSIWKELIESLASHPPTHRAHIIIAHEENPMALQRMKSALRSG